jgi:hypothetical protein
LLDENELTRLVKRLRAAGVEAESTAFLLATRSKQLHRVAEELAPGVTRHVAEQRPPETPLPEGEVERAAERAGVRAAEPKAPRELTADDRVALTNLAELNGRPSPIAEELLLALRETGSSSDEVARGLRWQARDLDYIADRITPEPKTRDDMLMDALDVLEAATSIFEHECTDDLLSEALRSSKDDIELFENASGNMTGGADSMAYVRAERRIELALKLDAFRKKHPTWKPVRAENDDENAKEAAGGVS